jgi:hypothetical protein
MELSYLLCADIYKRNALACQLQYNMPYTYQSSDALTISVLHIYLYRTRNLYNKNASTSLRLNIL